MDSTPNNSMGYALPGGQNIADTSDIVIDTTAPTLQTATVNGSSLILSYDEALKGASIPDKNNFTLTINGIPLAAGARIASVSVSGSAVNLTLSTGVIFTDTVLISYTPGVSPIQDLVANNANSLTNQSLTNVDNTPPTLTLASVNISTLTLAYSEPLNVGSTPPASDFELTINGIPLGAGTDISSVAISGSNIILTLTTSIVFTDTVSINYIS